MEKSVGRWKAASAHVGFGRKSRQISRAVMVRKAGINGVEMEYNRIDLFPADERACGGGLSTAQGENKPLFPHVVPMLKPKRHKG